MRLFVAFFSVNLYNQRTNLQNYLALIPLPAFFLGEVTSILFRSNNFSTTLPAKQTEYANEVLPKQL